RPGERLKLAVPRYHRSLLSRARLGIIVDPLHRTNILALHRTRWRARVSAGSAVWEALRRRCVQFISDSVSASGSATTRSAEGTTRPASRRSSAATRRPAWKDPAPSADAG